jgi:hypothetical protein
MSAVALVVDDPAALRTAVVGGIGRGCVRLRPAAPRRAALTWPTTSRERSRSRSDSSSAFRTGRRVITRGRDHTEQGVMRPADAEGVLDLTGRA